MVIDATECQNLLVCTISINHRLDLLHQSIIVVPVSYTHLLCNLGIAENNQRIGTLVADGKLGFGAVNLVFAVMFIVFEIVFFIKRSREKRDLSEEKAE